MGQEGSTVEWKWFIEWQAKDTAVMHGVKRYVYSARTKFQQIEIIDTYNYGTCLVLDGKIQSSTLDEYIYHEALVHPCLITHPRPRRVLIIGGGEGGALREVLKHSTVDEATMVDLDEEVIKVCKEFLPQIHEGSFDDKRAKVVIGEGRDFLAKQQDSYYDVIVVDVTDPSIGGPSYLLYTKEFYEMVNRKLKEDGMLCTQATSTFYSLNCFTAIWKTLENVFQIVRAYHTFIPSYFSTWGFLIGSKVYDPLAKKRGDLEKELKIRVLGDLKFYEPMVHEAMFSLPKYVKEAYLKQNSMVTDSNPVFMPA